MKKINTTGLTVSQNGGNLGAAALLDPREILAKTSIATAKGTQIATEFTVRGVGSVGGAIAGVGCGLVHGVIEGCKNAFKPQDVRNEELQQAQAQKMLARAEREQEKAEAQREQDRNTPIPQQAFVQVARG